MKKQIALFLACTMLFALFAGFTASAATYSGSCGDNVTWTVDTSTLTLTISGEGSMANYTSQASLPWYAYINNIMKVEIESGVTHIGAYAFCGHTIMTSISIPSSVSSIGNYAFYGCSKLLALTIPDSVTSIGQYTLQSCSKLRKLYIGTGITSMYRQALTGCNALEELTIPFIGLEKVTAATAEQYLFGTIFYYSSSTSQTALSVPDGYIHQPILTTKGGAYEYYDSYYTYGSRSYYYYYYFKIPATLKKVTVLDGIVPRRAFQNCTMLETVILGDAVTSVEEEAFMNCTALSEVSVGDGVTLIGESAFSGLASLASVTLGDSVSTIANSAFKNCTALEELDIPDGVGMIGDNAFSGCTSLGSADLPESVIFIGDGAYSGCEALSSVQIGKDTAYVGENAFKNCTGLSYAYFTGTENKWDDVIVGDGNEPLLSVLAFTPHTEHSYVQAWSYDAASHWHVCSVCGEIDEKLSHIYDNACDTTCNVCGATRTITHDYAEAWSNDSAQHWHECSVCHDKTDVATHTYDNACDTTCNVCGAMRVTEHVYDNDFDTACNVCGSERTVTDVSGTYGESCIFDYTDADKTLTLSGSAADALVGIDAPWKSIAGKISKIVISKTVSSVTGDIFAGVSSSVPVYVMGDPEIEDGALPKNNSIFGWSGTKLQNYCSANENAFTALEEFTALGYQVGATKNNMFRVIAQMRYADYYETAGFDITAVGSDGFGHDFNKSLTQNISKVYKSVSASSSSGVQYTAVTAEDGCYLSAFGMTGLPEMAAGAKIVFTVTPFVYNIFSGEKVSLDPVMLQYTADGISQYIEESSGLKTDEGTTEGGVINWNEI